MRTVALLVPIVACFVAGLPANAAGADPLLRYHPEPGALPDLKIVEGSHQFAAGADLTTIYDGGYQRYLKAGVTRASQRYYDLGGRSTELVVHELRSEKAARAFFESFCRETKAKVEKLTIGSRTGSVCVLAAEGSAYGYVWVARFFLSSSTDKAEAAVPRALLTASAERIVGKPAKAATPPGKAREGAEATPKGKGK
jgi:hypothetical protein